MTVESRTIDSQAATSAAGGTGANSLLIENFQLEAPVGGGPATSTHYFKMRGLANPGPGYVVWVVSGVPDFVGTYAPAPIQGSSVVVVADWVVDL